MGKIVNSRQSNEFSRELLAWYGKNKRDLPWRHTGDPYKIWLSEIILQQTRVSQGLPYYQHFCKLFPSIHDLAEASEDSVLKAWQGLGYYSRARNLHHTAKVISGKYGGAFPANHKEILALKGIGKYTAAAIASFSFGIVEPVVDGNVCRVVSRFYAIREPIDQPATINKIYKYARKLIPNSNPGEFNQAIMELGAMVCTPANPACSKCPVSFGCRAFGDGAVHEIPLKVKKTKVVELWFIYAVIEHKKGIYLKKRSEKGIWRNLYDFPLIEKTKKPADKDLVSMLRAENLIPENSKIEHISDEFIHLLTHRKIHARFIHIKSSYSPKANTDNIFSANSNKLSQFAFPKLIEKYLISRNMLPKNDR